MMWRLYSNYKLLVWEAGERYNPHPLNPLTPSTLSPPNPLTLTMTPLHPLTLTISPSPSDPPSPLSLSLALSLFLSISLYHTANQQLPF